jgi:hypothetical protein
MDDRVAAERGDRLVRPAAEMLLDRQLVHLGERLVDPHVAKLRVEEEHPHGGGSEQRVEQDEGVLRGAERLLRLAVEQRVVDGGGDTPSDVLREGEIRLVVPATRRIASSSNRSIAHESASRGTASTATFSSVVSTTSDEASTALASARYSS